MKCCAISVAFFLACQIGHAQPSKLDSLKKELASASDNDKIELYKLIVTGLWLNRPDSAMLYAEQAIGFAKSRSARDKAIAHRLKGAVYFYLDQYDSAIKYNYQALLFSEQAKDSILVANAMNNVGLAFFYVGSYPKALEYLLKSLQIKKRLKGNALIGRTMNNIGRIYIELKQFDKAKDFFSKALSLAENADEKMYALNSLGTVTLSQGNAKDAENYFLKAKDLGATTENAVDESTTLSGLGRTSIELGKLQEAKKYLNESLRIREPINEFGGIAEVYLSYSTIYKKAGNFDSTIFYLRKSQQLAGRVRARDITLLCYKSLAGLFSEKGKFDSAFYYQSKFVALRDSLLNENLFRNINDIQLQIQDEENKSVLSEKDREISLRTYQSYSFAAFAMLIMIAAIGFYRSRNRERKLRHLVDSKTAELQKNLDDLKRAQVQLVQSEKMASLGLLTAGIAHEINNPINFISVGIAALEHKIAQLNNSQKDTFELVETRNKINQLIKDIKIGTTRTEEIISSLRTFSQTDRAELKNFDINEGIESTLVLLNSKLKDRIEVLRNLDKNLPQILCNPGQLNQVFMNVLTNSIDAIKEKGKITIATNAVNSHVEISIADTGCGMTSEVQEKLFQPFFTTKSIGAGTGLGLSISYGIIQKHNGTITVSSEVGKGTEFTISLPMNLNKPPAEN